MSFPITDRDKNDTNENKAQWEINYHLFVVIRSFSSAFLDKTDSFVVVIKDWVELFQENVTHDPVLLSCFASKWEDIIRL